jgi:protein TonB
MSQARQISTTEFVKKPPPEKKIIQQRVRQVNQNTTKGKSEGSRMAMRITPDLAVDGPDNGNGAVVTKQEVKAEVFEEGQVDEPAAAILKTPLKYPERARELGIEGALQVEFIVSHQGKVTDIQIISSPSPDITAEAKRTIATWKFKPAKNKGIPVNMRFRQAIDFKLD